MLYFINLIIILFPLYLIKIHIFSIPFTVLELMIYILFLFWVLQKKEQVNFKDLPLAPLALIFLGVLISTIFSDDKMVSLGILKGWFFVPIIFLFVISQVVKTREQIKNIFLSLFFSGAGVAAVSFFYFLSGNMTFDGRLKSFYLSPNHLAMALASSILIGFWFLIHADQRKEKLFYGIVLSLILCAFYLTYSYSAWLAVFFGILFLMFFALIKQKIKIFVAVSFIFVAGVLFFSQINTEKFLNILNERGSLASRIMIWKVSFELVKSHPIVGIGPGMFQTEYLKVQNKFEPYLEWAVPQPHNIFIAFWLQTGILGLIGFVWLVVLFFKQGFQVIKNKDREFIVLCLGIMIYILIHGLIDTLYWKNDLSVIFWLIIFIPFLKFLHPQAIKQSVFFVNKE